MSAPRAPEAPHADTPSEDAGSGWVSARQISRVRSLIAILEAEIPELYRVEAFRALVPGLVPRRAVGEAPPSAVSPPGRATRPLRAPSLEGARLDLARYREVLALPGRMPLKALVALDVAAAQLGIDWMTPAEMERLLTERARVRSVYRTNLSNALRGAPGLVDRRRRGRGFEYRLTDLGREVLARELALLGG